MNHSTKNDGSVRSERKKNSGHFNFIDFILIILVLAILAIAIDIFAPFSKIRAKLTNDSKTIEYTVEVLGVDEVFIDKIKENDTVMDSVSKNHLGTVTAVDYNTKYTELQYVQQGDQKVGILAEYPHRYNVIVTISVSAEYSSGSGYFVGNVRIAVGELFSLRFPDYSCEGYCIGLTAVS